MAHRKLKWPTRQSNHPVAIRVAAQTLTTRQMTEEEFWSLPDNKVLFKRATGLIW